MLILLTPLWFWEEPSPILAVKGSDPLLWFTILTICR